ncbi:MAG: hypothetical protein JW744_01530 [Candidatus Diapherotrites archaeon]|uniref:Uncharacterized protein n=1 Tax=Candidatus Iainarchaeum sp. TaxID=3101447 RepID=A0A939C674_9ARCH|nr:hypothetical protein [Candidatus Diapherotrites archaeon]
MEQVALMFVRGAFFFIVGVILATLFVWCLVEGAMSHLSSGPYTLAYYFASFVAGVGAFTLYHEAKSVLHYAQISK